MNILTDNIIGYHTSAGSQKTLQGFDPVSGNEITEKFNIASLDDVNNAVLKANKAFFALKSIAKESRAAFLEAIANEMESLGDVLVQRASLETGLPEARIIGERGRTTGQLRMFAKYIREGSYVEATIDTAIPDRAPVAKPDLRKMMVALGPVVVFGASNFPLAYSVAGGDTAAALAAGCPVIVKAHPGHPGTSALVGMAIQKAAQDNGMPDGVFSLLYDSGFAIGKALVEHPLTAAVGFTGSTMGGRALFDIAAARANPIPVFAEMGSINPSVLFPEALASRAETIAINYAGSITLGAGQFCTNPGLLLAIEGDGLSHFIDKLTEEIAKVVPATMLHKGISASYHQKLKDLEKELGVEFLSQSAAEGESSQGRPTLASATGAQFLSNSKLHEEVFGPYSLIIICKDAQELSNCVAKIDGQLTTTVIADAKDIAEHKDIISMLQEKAGRIIFNGVPTGVEVCPSMLHGGPYPATTDSRFTAVGVHSIKRFIRPLSFQDAPAEVLPVELRNENDSGIWRTINGEMTKDSVN